MAEEGAEGQDDGDPRQRDDGQHDQEKSRQ
jgi:hypothetical protein